MASSNLSYVQAKGDLIGHFRKNGQRMTNNQQLFPAHISSCVPIFFLVEAAAAAALVVDTAGACPVVVEWAVGVGRLLALTTVLDTVEGVSFLLTSWGGGECERHEWRGGYGEE